MFSSCPAEAERDLAYVGLGDLLDGVLDDLMGALSPPRRHALQVALLLDEAGDEAIDHRAIAVALHDVLSLLSERKPVVVAIDDVQWLDACSVSALAFACCDASRATSGLSSPAGWRRRSSSRRSASNGCGSDR